MKSLTPGQQVVKITNEALVQILGGEAKHLETGPKSPSTVLVAGLNGSGKTTTAAKLAAYLKKEGDFPMLIAADLHRPAAIEQLQALGQQIEVEVYEEGSGTETANVARNGLKRAKELKASWAIFDTAGRFQIDTELMQELEEVKKAIDPTETLLVVDAMAGQDAVNAAAEFHERIGVTGLVLSLSLIHI